MTQYAYDRSRSVVTAVWAAGRGRVAESVADVPAEASADRSLDLAHALDALSAAVWRTYTHPASAAGSLEVNTEGWRRGGERGAFDSVVPAIREPNLPRDGLLMQSYSPVEETAHRVGRALHAIGDATLTEAIAGDVEAELAAVQQAELGNLSGRARQAVALTRADASPVQVVAADRLLEQDPLGCEALFTEVDGTAAAVAAAHWLKAAADVVEARSGPPAADVVAEADNIEALPHETPTRVLGDLEVGATPRDVVVDLVHEAMLVAEGYTPDLDALLGEVEEAETRAAQWADKHGEDLRDELLPGRLTPLDPSRPAHDMLEDLLAGVHGCGLLFVDYVDVASSDDDDDRTDESPDAQIHEMFLAEVREEAQLQRSRLV